MPQDSQRQIAIDDLRPTQLSVGFIEVDKRVAKIQAMSADKLEAYLDKKAVPVVKGPDHEYYLTDHHHLCCALLKAGQKSVRLGEVRDYSDVAIKDFWPKMRADGFCWPIDAHGNLRPYAAIPRRFEDMTNNVWRDLAREVRDVAFTDEDTPFQEFMWGDYFRTFMSERLIGLAWDAAVELATKVAALDEAQDLPGYVGNAAGDRKKVRQLAKDRGLDRDDSDNGG